MTNKMTNKMNKKILFVFAIIFISVFLIGIASAGIAKNYDDGTNTIAFNDTGNLFQQVIRAIPIIDNLATPERQVASITLLTPHFVNVFVGNDVQVARFNMTLKNDTQASVIFNGMKFLNENDNNNTIERNYKYKYISGYYEIDTPVYKQDCIIAQTLSNGTQITKCHNTNAVDYIVNNSKPIWTTIDMSNTLTAGDYVVGVYADTLSGDYVDWTPTWLNNYISEFAVWNSSFNNGLYAVENFSGITTGGSLLETITGGNQNLTRVGETAKKADTWTVQGGSTYVASGGNNPTLEFVNDANFRFNSASVNWNMTMSWWFYRNSTGTNYLYCMYGGSSALLLIDSVSEFYIHGFSTSDITIAGAPLSSWAMLTVTRNDTQTCAYIDGTTKMGCSNSPKATAGANTLSLGGCVGDTGNPTSAYYDEMYFWNRTLTPNEIDSLYNSGTGIFYSPPPSDSEYPQFSNYQDDSGTKFAGQTGSFNTTVTSTNGTVILHFGGNSYTATNSSGDPTQFNVLVTLPSTGTYSYNWTSWGNGTSNLFNISNTRSYTVLNDTTYPQFSNYQDDSGTKLIGQQGSFNVTVTSTNGTVILHLGSNNYAATNSSGDATQFNVLVTLPSPSGTYSYNWTSWGNGTSNLFNISNTQNYVILNDTTYPQFSNYGDNSGTQVGGGTGIFNVSVSNTNGSVYLFLSPFNNSLNINKSSTYCDNTNINNCANAYDNNFSTGANLKVVLGVSSSGMIYNNFTDTTGNRSVSLISYPSINCHVGVNNTIIAECYNSSNVWERIYAINNNFNSIRTDNIDYSCNANVIQIRFTLSTNGGSVCGDGSDNVKFWESEINSTWNNWSSYSASNKTGNPSIFNVTVPNFPAGTYTYYWGAYGNGTNNNYNASDMRNYLVLSSPGINILYPSNGTNSSNNNLNVNYTVSSGGSGIGSCWYSNDTYSVNTTLADCGTNITSVLWSDGLHKVTVWVNDSIGNLNSSEVEFTIYTGVPTVTITSPLNQTYLLGYSTNASQTTQIDLNYTVSGLFGDSCWYSENGGATNISFPNCHTNATINVPYGSQKFIVYTNDSFGNVGSSSVTASWQPVVLQNSMTFNNQTTSGSSETFKVNYTIFNSAGYLGTLVYLNYNNTNYTAITSDAGDTKVFSSTVTIPLVNTATNMSFYWLVGLVNSTGTTYYNSASNSQIVIPIFVDNCTTFTNPIMNLSIADEDSLVPINGTIEVAINLYPIGTTNLISTYNGTFYYTVPNPVKICVSNSNSNYSMSYILKYYGNGSYYPQYKTVQYANIYDGQTQNIILYDLLVSSGSPFQISLRGVSNIQNVLVDVQRQYIPLNSFLSVESSATDTNGNMVAHLVSGTVIYNFLVSQNGIPIASFNNYEVQVGVPITLNLAEPTATETDFNNYGNVSEVYLWDNNTRTLFLTYQATDGNFHTITQTVNQAGNQVCYRSQLGMSGTLNCPIPLYYGNDTLVSSVSVDGSIVGTTTITIGQTPQDVFGGTRVIMQILLYCSLVMLLLSSPVLIVIGSIFGMILGAALFLVSGTGTTNIVMVLGWLVAAGIIIAWQIGRRS